ncbi:hypothetical protein [Baekduia sp.]|jgi:hypothetical protein|uniref:hypothetical protein n=1 Tax=Baekduia sp. TaxID=2600305 RepID=UPI002E05C5CD|nr:hypothetical protein [Baekduia sp.]
MLMTLRAVAAVLAQTSLHDDRSALFTVLLVGLGAAVGVIVGVLPALVAAVLLGYLPPPRLRRWDASGVLLEPRLIEFAAERAPTAEPAPVVLAAAEEPSGDPSPRSRPLAILAHARHQAVYDAAYAEQLDRVETLRSAIGGRRSKAPEPPAD